MPRIPFDDERMLQLDQIVILVQKYRQVVECAALMVKQEIGRWKLGGLRNRWPRGSTPQRLRHHQPSGMSTRQT